MIREFPESLLPAAGSAWIGSAQLGAGIYLLHGESHMVGHGTAMERRLQERGALHVASVRFDRAEEEAYHPARDVRALDAAEARRRFASERSDRFAWWRGAS
jgi:hypothetical protein